MLKRLALNIILFLPLVSQAQFLNAFGIMGGATVATHKYRFTNTEFDSNKYITGLNGSCFWELFDKDHFRWQTELQYNQKGSIDKYDQTLKNRVHYFCWNNFLKIRSMRIAGTPYALVGPRIEYLFWQDTQSPDMQGRFNRIHISGSLGIGWEFEVHRGPKPFVEMQFNPDMFMPAYNAGDFRVRNFVLELRVGAKLYWNRDRCPKTNRK